MARIVAHAIIYLGLICSIASADESADKEAQNVASETGYKTPELSGFAHLVETFDDEEAFKKTWVLSEAKKDSIDEDIAKYDGPPYVAFTVQAFKVRLSCNLCRFHRSLVRGGAEEARARRRPGISAKEQSEARRVVRYVN